MDWLRRRIVGLLQHQSGATSIEYALIASLLSIVIVGALLALNGSMTNLYQYIEGFIVPALGSDV